VIPHGIGERFRPPSAERVEAVRARLGLPRRYVLYVGTLEPRKNLTVLLEAYARLVTGGRVDEDLVLVGRLGWERSELMRAAAHDAIRGRVHVTGWVEDDVLPVLYAGARAFVYPSIEEGFGFPPLEAMAAGVPTVSSDTSSLRENLAGAAELVAPTDVVALTAALGRVLADERLRAKLVRAGLERAGSFRWDESARSTLRCYAELAAGQAGGRREALASIGR
jgi:glycosyltransferase involved in cell wall biosynthesis